MNKKDPQTNPTLESDEETSSNRINTILQPVVVIFDKLLPPYEPRVDIDKKLVKGEETREHAIVRHFSEIQLTIGIIVLILGPVLQALLDSAYFIFVTILGFIILFSAYEMEEIYVTSHRIIVRRVGMVERIIRVPSDEEHALEHLVSYNVGRAPANLILVGISIFPFLVIFNDQMNDFIQLLILLTGVIILIFGLRIRRRGVTLHLAGGLNIMLGLRKGIPKRIVTALQIAMYEDQPTLQKQDTTRDFDEDEKPAKEV